MKIDFEKITTPKSFAKAKSRGSRNILGISITYADKGKRVTITNPLAERLNLMEKVYIGLSVSERQVIISNRKYQNLDEYKLNSGYKIYNAALVEGILTAMEIEEYYEGRSSVTFKDTEVFVEDGYAVISIPLVEDIGQRANNIDEGGKNNA